MKAIARERYTAALAKFPSGVTVVTTVDDAGRPWGFTASAFTSVSLDPPEILVCLDRSADCHAAFVASKHFAVHIVGRGQEELARRFATKGEDKFAGVDHAPGSWGSPLLPDALVALECRIAAQLPGGDHTILVGDVLDAHVRAGEPAVYVDHSFRQLTDGAASPQPAGGTRVEADSTPCPNTKGTR